MNVSDVLPGFAIAVVMLPPPSCRWWMAAVPSLDIARRPASGQIRFLGGAISVGGDWSRKTLERRSGIGMEGCCVKSTKNSGYACLSWAPS